VEPPYECAVIDVQSDTAGIVAVTRQCVRLGEPQGPDAEPVFSPEREEWLFDGWQWRSTE
jgi:hypothetical protein